jgi:hypothetical protein
MEKYEGIRSQVERARIQRSVFLAELLADLIVGSWNGLKAVATRLTDLSKIKPALRNNVFTFDA